MKIAIQNPFFIFSDPLKNFNGYCFEFLKKYTSAIYLTKPWQIFKYKKRLLELGCAHIDCIFRLKTLNHRIDILVGFLEQPHLPHHSPPKNFEGLKVWHLFDYVFRPSDALKALQSTGVQKLLGYARHDLHCNFFKQAFKPYLGHVIPVPFGFSSRFKSKTPFSEREAKCVALGSVNPIDDPLCLKGVLDEYIKFYPNKTWTHEFRRTLAENSADIPLIHSLLPNYPNTKNFTYDPVSELNRFQLFVNDEGIMNFPPARTYEGIACGTVMIASDNPIYRELGFIPDINYIAFEKNTLADFQNKLSQIIRDPLKLRTLHTNSLKLAERYTHAAVADGLYQNLLHNFPPQAYDSIHDD